MNVERGGDDNLQDTAVSVHAPQQQLVSIVVPTRNEADNVATLVDRLCVAMGKRPFEIVFVDDSNDNTPQIIQEIADACAIPIVLLARPPEKRNGLSGAVVDGFRAARGAWICVMDADLQHPPALIPLLLARAQEADADIVVGSRKADIGGPRGLSRKRAMTSQLLTLLARAWFPRLLKNVSDPLTGLFLLRREALDIEVLRPDGFKILLEILIRCPGLRVSELYFDFAERHDGESKADFREGMRFFRHLLRLRMTANQSFPRLIVVALLSLLLDTAVFVALSRLTGWSYGVTAVLSAELFILLRFKVTEQWVLGGGHPVAGWPSLSRFLFSNQLSLFLVRLPLLYLFVMLWGWSLAAGMLLAIVLEGIVRYAFSEQWVFSLRGWRMTSQTLFHYNIHDILHLESQVELAELAYFATAVPAEHVDIQIRVDRHGTPSPQPGAICYNEKLSRFGFGVAIMLGEYTEVVVSPALQKAPYALYKSILEPILRWAFVQKGFALVYGGCVAKNGRAMFVVPQTEMGKTETILKWVAQEGVAFLADDFTIVAATGELFAFPKPVTVSKPLLSLTKTKWSLGRRLKLWVQGLVYAQASRESGILLSERRWPMATVNIYLQRFLTPPKEEVKHLIYGVEYAPSATLEQLFWLECGPDRVELLAGQTAVQLVQQRHRDVTGFPPYRYLITQLAHGHGLDFEECEQAIIATAFAPVTAKRICVQNGRWWQLMKT